MADMIDGIDDIVVLRELEFLDSTPRDQIIDRSTVTFGVDRDNTFAQYLDLGALYASGQCMQLAVGIADVDIVVIDQCDIADTRPRASFRCPGTYAANTHDTKLCLLQGLKRGHAKYPAQAVKALQVFFAQHAIIFLV